MRGERGKAGPKEQQNERKMQDRGKGGLKEKEGKKGQLLRLLQKKKEVP